jgi:two-component system LytT family response regulator
VPDRILVREGERTIVVPLADVSWIEASGNHVLLHAAGQVHRVRDTLANVEARLDPARFARIHRRFIVAVAAMCELRPWSGGDQVLVLRDGAKLPVSRNYRQALAARLQAGG